MGRYSRSSLTARTAVTATTAARTSGARSTTALITTRRTRGSSCAICSQTPYCSATPGRIFAGAGTRTASPAGRAGRPPNPTISLPGAPLRAGERGGRRPSRLWGDRRRRADAGPPARAATRSFLQRGAAAGVLAAWPARRSRGTRSVAERPVDRVRDRHEHRQLPIDQRPAYHDVAGATPCYAGLRVSGDFRAGVVR